MSSVAYWIQTENRPFLSSSAGAVRFLVVSQRYSMIQDISPWSNYMTFFTWTNPIQSKSWAVSVCTGSRDLTLATWALWDLNSQPYIHTCVQNLSSWATSQTSYFTSSLAVTDSSFSFNIKQWSLVKYTKIGDMFSYLSEHGRCWFERNVCETVFI